MNQETSPVRKFDYSGLRNSILDEKKTNILSPMLMAGSMISRSADLRKLADKDDKDFQELKTRAFGNRDEKINLELDRYRRQKELMNQKQSDEDKLLNKFLAEIHYKNEIETRAKQEIEEMKFIIANLESSFATQKKIETKKELSQLLLEREMIYKFEQELYSSILEFKEFYDKWEYDRISGKKFTQGEINEKLQRMNLIKTKKEQVDYERKRIQDNFDRIKSGELKFLEKTKSNILLTELANPHRNFYNTNIYGIESMKIRMNEETNKLMDLRKEREDMLKYEQLNFEDTRNSYGYRNIINKYVTDIEKSAITPEEKFFRLKRIRENITKYGIDEGFNLPDKKSDYEYGRNTELTSALKEINKQKQDYIVHGGKDANFILELEKMEDDYKDRFKSKYYSNKDEYLPSNDRFSKDNLLDGYPLMPKSNRSIFQENVRFPGYDETLSVRQKIVELKTTGQNIDNMLKNSNENLYLLQNKLSSSLAPTEIKGDAVHIQTEEERLLNEYRAQEQEIMKALASIAPGTDIYKYKISQLKRLGDLKRELEKIIQEQRQQRLWNQVKEKKQAEDMKKREIALRLRRNIYGVNPREYDPNNGLVIHFEFMNGIPKKYDFIKSIFAIYARGEMLYTPKLLDGRKCEPDTVYSEKCVFDETFNIYDIPPFMDCMIIFEFQAHYDIGIDHSEKMEMLGWTVLDLFDFQRKLKRGRWKMPLYFRPVNTMITAEQVKDLRRIDGIWFYTRILFPDDEEFMIDSAKPIDAAATEHQIPPMHLRDELEVFKPFIQDQKTNLITIMKQGAGKKSSSPSISSSSSESSSSESEEEKDDKNEEEAKRLKELQDEIERLKKLQTEPKEKLDINIDLDNNKGLRIVILSIKGINTGNKFRVENCMFLEDKILIDDINRTCYFRTKPKVLVNQEAQDDEENKNDEAIPYNEEFLYLRNFPAIILMKGGKLELILNLQVVEADYDPNAEKTKMEIPELDKLPEESGLDDKNQSTSYAKNFRVLEDKKDDRAEYQPSAWYSIKLNQPDGTIQYGRFTKNMLVPPSLKPPFDENRIEKSSIVIEYVIEEFVYNAAYLASLTKEKKTKKVKKLDLSKKFIPKEIAATIDGRPFIVNTKKQYEDRPFEKGNGIDFYIDGARFLPDNATVTKVVLTIMSQSMEKIAPPKADLALLDSKYTYSPKFEFKMELRAPHFDPTAIALISIDTLDKNNNDEVRIVGYSAMNLFINSKTKEQPKSESENDVILLNGAYQLPIYCQEPLRKRPFNMSRMIKLDKMPCASLLVRVRRAPKDEDGVKILTKDDVAKQDWEKKGVMVPAPEYGAGQYNTSFCQVRDSEKELFILRQLRPDQSVRLTATILMNSAGLTDDLDDEKILNWIDNKIIKTLSTPIIDLQYFAKYQMPSGFKFALDGFHNVPEEIPYVGLYCLNPPAALYNSGDRNQVHLNSNFNWESPYCSPQFLEGYVTFRDVKFDKNLTLIIDVRTVTFKKKGQMEIIKPIGWTALPIFSPDKYVMSGIYQLPIFKGPVIPEILKELPEQDPWHYLMEKMNEKKTKLEFLEPMSAIVRLLDGQREGHFQIPFDHERMNHSYLPKKRASVYIYNGAIESKLEKVKRLSSIVPLRGDPKKYNQKVTKAFVKELKLEQYSVKETDQRV